LVNANFFFLLILIAKREDKSCKVPNGQMLEQYILPNNNVNIRTIINPAKAGISRLKKFIVDGIN